MRYTPPSFTKTLRGRPEPAEAIEIVGWRRRHLVAAGFAPALAQALAREVHLDLHAVLELVDRGCPPDLAARILAPVHREVGA